ncbi:MAG: late competence development ComFB family protein [Clostridium sp.]|nr:late competence development ComFB family protein [Clostridium sp.]MCM1399442.1 late competence development ComFB family protein [Clostridium sp.]MCM1459996.1 late competence development ComFB family protein [Bacteroides sp.]
MKQLVNLMEETVFNKIDELWSDTQYCKCEDCRMDIATYALNRLPAQYVQSLRGKVMYRFESQQTQSDVDVTVIVGKAIGIVGNAPHRNTAETN